MKPIRIFTGDDVLLPGFWAEYLLDKNQFLIRRITKEEFEKLKAQGIPVTGWFVKRKRITLWDFDARWKRYKNKIDKSTFDVSLMLAKEYLSKIEKMKRKFECQTVLNVGGK